jgi:hypothetical protein
MCRFSGKLLLQCPWVIFISMPKILSPHLTHYVQIQSNQVPNWRITSRCCYATIGTHHPTPFKADMVKIVNALVKAAASCAKWNIGDGDGPDKEAEDSRQKKKLQVDISMFLLFVGLLLLVNNIVWWWNIYLHMWRQKNQVFLRFGTKIPWKCALLENVWYKSPKHPILEPQIWGHLVWDILTYIPGSWKVAFTAFWLRILRSSAGLCRRPSPSR